MRSAIDNRPPARYRHLFENLKKAQIEDERNMEIERENRLLLEKMSTIMDNVAPDAGNTVEFIPGTRINQNQYPSVDNYKVRHTRSLNKEKRRRELVRITNENQKLLQRIQKKEPYYNHFEWHMQTIQNEKYKRMIQEYPSVSRSVNSAGLYTRKNNVRQLEPMNHTTGAQPEYVEFNDSAAKVNNVDVPTIEQENPADEKQNEEPAEVIGETDTENKPTESDTKDVEPEEPKQEETVTNTDKPDSVNEVVTQEEKTENPVETETVEKDEKPSETGESTDKIEETKE